MSEPILVSAPPSKAAPASEAVQKYPMLLKIMAPGWEERVVLMPDAKADSSAARILADETLRFKADPTTAEAEACVAAGIDLLAQLGDALAIARATTALTNNFGLTKPTITQAVRQSFAENGAPDRFKKVAHATTDIYYDSTHKYYRKVGDTEWDSMASEQAKRHLKVGFSLADTLGENDDYSEVDQALHHIETKNRVTAALPFPLWEDTVVTHNGERFLNMCQTKLTLPAEGPHTWGDRFPWVSDYVDGLFENQQNKEAFLAWLRQWYTKVRQNRGDGGRGVATFLVGPTGSGKTLMTRWILGGIFGGYADVCSSFVDGKGFNSNNFKHVVWCIDDAKSITTPAAIQAFSSEVKRVVANPDYDYDSKFGYKGTVPFNGRFVCSLNTGVDEIKLLPDVDMHMMDKVQLLCTSSRICPTPDRDTINKEIPHFLAWLEQSETPAWLLEKTPEMVERGLSWRFGFKPYHDPHVLEESRSLAKSAELGEVISMWLNHIQVTDGSLKGRPGYDEKTKKWTCTATELLSELGNTDSIRRVIPKGMTTGTLGKMLTKLEETGKLTNLTRKKTGSDRLLVFQF